jgi:hypothetical protein
LSSVSNLEERLKFFLYKLEFADKLAEIRPGVESVRVATTEFNNNKKWMQILEVRLPALLPRPRLGVVAHPLCLPCVCRVCRLLCVCVCVSFAARSVFG